MPKRTTQNQKKVGKVVFSIEKNLKTKPHTPSAHVVNLKKIAHEKEVTHHNHKKSLKHISSDALFVVERKLAKSSQKFNTFFSSTNKPTRVAHIPPQQTPIYTVELEGPHLVQSLMKENKKHSPTKKQFKLPTFTLPTFTLPTFTLPTFTLPTFKRTPLRIPRAHRLALRATAVFSIIALILTSPLIALDYYHQTTATKGRVLGIAHAAVDHLVKSKEVFGLKDYASAAFELKSAQEDFAKLNAELAQLPKSITLVAQALPVGQDLSSAQTLIDLAQILLGLGSDIVSLLDTQSDETLTQKLDRITLTLDTQKAKLAELTQQLNNIDPTTLPDQYQDILKQITSYQNTFTQHLDEVVAYQKLINALLGNTSKQRFLLIFQNPNELRATGGFMGSFAQVDIDQGHITNVSIPTGGIYDLEAGLDANITPPPAFTLLNDRWEIQDSNYYPDFEKSARNISWFYERSGQSTVDGVIAVTPSIITQLLKLTGPIYISGRDQFITSENFIEVTQHEVEFGADKLELDAPKKILSDLAPLLLEKLMGLSNQELVYVATILHEALGTRDAQLFFTNTELQSFAQKFRWTGNLINTHGDYLHLSTTNIAGAKSDAVIDDSVQLAVDASQPDYQLHTLTITRTHSGDIAHPLSGVKHNDYLRIYVPLGSQLISAQGFEPITLPTAVPQEIVPTELAFEESTATIDPTTATKTYQEDSHTVFANWIQTDVGETQTVQVTYKTFLPNKEDSTAYSIYIQKQAGKKPTPYYTTITTPKKQEIVWSYPSSNSSQATQIQNETMLTQDLLIGVVASQQP